MNFLLSSSSFFFFFNFFFKFFYAFWPLSHLKWVQHPWPSVRINGIGATKGRKFRERKTSRDLFYTVIPFASWCLTPLFKTFYVNFTQTKTTKLKLPSRETVRFLFLSTGYSVSTSGNSFNFQWNWGCFVSTFKHCNSQQMYQWFSTESMTISGSDQESLQPA